jgi:hypothetical protein
LSAKEDSVNIIDVKNNITLFAGKNKKLLVSAVVVLLLMIGVSICIEINYAFIESKVKKTDPEYRIDRFYYNYITYREQLLYTNIVEAIETCAEYTKTLPYKYSAEELKCVMKYLLADNPEYFYLNSSSAELFSSRHKTRIRLTYFNTPEEIETMRTELYMALDVARMSLNETDD